jgi:hypothetical protein
MSQPKKILGFFFSLLCSIGAFRAFVQASAATPSPSPLHSSGPVTDYNLAVPNPSDVLRFRRGGRFNNPIPATPELGEDSETTLWDLPETHFKKDPMPFDGSEAVVAGTVTAGQAHLSNDKRNIDSESKLKIQGIVKAPNGSYLRVSDSIDIHRKGGAIRLPSGKVLVRFRYSIYRYDGRRTKGNGLNYSALTRRSNRR